MISLALVVAVLVVLLAVAASFGSWLFGQWIGARPRAPAAVLALGGVGAVLLTGAATFAVIATTAGWKPFMSMMDLSAPLLAPAMSSESNVAPPDVRKRVSVLLKATYEAVRARDWKTALAHLSEAQAVDGRKDNEDFQIAEFLVYVHLQMRNYEEAATALEQQLNWPGMDDAQRLPRLRAAAQIYFQIKGYAKAIAVGQEYLGKNPADADMRALLAQALYLAGRSAEAENEIDAAIAAYLAMGKEVPASWLQIRLSLARRSGDSDYRKQVQQDLSQNYPQHRDTPWPDPAPTERHIVVSPPDTPPVGAPFPSGAVAPDPLLKDWPATDCVKSSKSPNGDFGRWFLDNDCQRVVAVVFAWCQQTQAACNANARLSRGWSYEPVGIVMTSLTQRLSRQRLGGDGPLIAATYALRSQPDDSRRRIRYLACHVTAPELLTLLDESRDVASTENQSRRLQAALNADPCYTRVARWSRVGQREGKSPDALLRDGVVAED